MKKFRLVKAHHPTAFENGVYAVHFVEKGKPLVDRYTRFFMLKAKDKKSAVSLARRKLKDKL